MNTGILLKFSPNRGSSGSVDLGYKTHVSSRYSVSGIVEEFVFCRIYAVSNSTNSTVFIRPWSMNQILRIVADDLGCMPAVILVALLALFHLFKKRCWRFK